VGLTEVLDRRHMRLKDWILFYDAQLAPQSAARVNTGNGRFITRVMPSQDFPSDHAIVACTLRGKAELRPVSMPVLQWGL
jgi:hypothetical protein